MRKQFCRFAAFFIIILLAGTGFGQNPIPNPGFENWTGNTPDDWFANNPPTGQPPVTQSSDARSGASSARLEVVDLSGFPFPPQLSAGSGGNGFPVNQRYAAVTGWYKFNPQSGDILNVGLVLFQGGSSMAFAQFNTSVAAPNWTQFTAPINYTAPGTPDQATLLVQVVAVTSTGSVAQVDDVELTGVSALDEPGGGALTAGFQLQQNFPNPFNPSTTIAFDLSISARVSLEIFNASGQKIATLVQEALAPGNYKIPFNGGELSSGIYFYRLSVDGHSQIKSMNLLK